MRSHAVILNRRMLLATIGLTLPALGAEAATRKKAPKKPATPKVASHKPRRPATAKPHAQS